MARVFLVGIIQDEEDENRRNLRNLQRNIRDASNPFECPEENFRKMYRLSRECARDLIATLEPFMPNQRRITAIPNFIKCLAAFHFYGHGSYQKSVGKDYYFAMSQSAVSRCIKEVSTVLTQHMLNDKILFPVTPAALLNVKRGFFDKFGFPGIIGAIDGTHIGIVPPPANHPIYPALPYIDRRGNHSINVQIICCSDLRITAIDARFPGSVHDSAIWMMSGIQRRLMNLWRNGHLNHSWLLGDSGYPLQPYLMTPIVGAEENTPEGRYNDHQILSRNCIERCIGVLKAVYRCLRKDRILHYDPIAAGEIIYACAILHNIRLEYRLPLPAIDPDDEYDDPVNNPGDVQHNWLREGRAVQ